MFHSKYLDAVDNGIDFTADFLFPTRLNLDSYDLAVILNNSLENAIEACSNVTGSDRYVRLYAYTKGEMFFIEVENSFMGQIDFDKQTALPISSKSDKTVHGIGLSNIQRCAKKYFGDIDIQIFKVKNYNAFRLIIMLQGRA